jgi:outer membrane receptor protein involved in Fe transport
LQDFSVRLDNEWKLNANNLFAFGAQLTRADVTYENVRDDTLSVLQRDQASTQIAVYAQNTWDYKDRIELTAGVRGVHYDATSSFYVEPRLSAMARLTDRVSVKAAAGVYNQFVARVVNENVTEGARDFWLLADGETVGVNGATHLIAGASYETANWLFDTEVFYKDITDLTEFSLRYQREANFGPGGPNLVADELFFTGDGTAKGLEVLLQKKRGRLTGWLSYTLSNVEHVFPELNDGEGFPALHDQEHELKLVNSLRLGRWNIAATWTFATGKPYTAPISEYSITLLDGSELSYIHVGGKNSERLPAYHRMDTSVHYTTHVRGTGLDVGFSIFNLYNRSNVWYREFDLSESPMVTTDITFLGITPNLSIRLDF